jgi:hypothetical protein
MFEALTQLVDAVAFIEMHGLQALREALVGISPDALYQVVYKLNPALPMLYPVPALPPVSKTDKVSHVKHCHCAWQEPLPFFFESLPLLYARHESGHAYNWSAVIAACIKIRCKHCYKSLSV